VSVVYRGREIERADVTFIWFGRKKWFLVAYDDSALWGGIVVGVVVMDVVVSLVVGSVIIY
jgi:hypothetical protein